MDYNDAMVEWPEDGAMLTNKADKLARYHEIKGPGDPPMPTLIAMEIPPLPPLVGSEPEPNIPAEVDNASSKALLLFAMEV